MKGEKSSKRARDGNLLVSTHQRYQEAESSSSPSSLREKA